MATIAENLQTIQNIKQNIKTAIENKGVDMSNTTFSDYSTKIDEITTGGSLDFSPIGYDAQLSRSIIDGYDADIAYSKQLLDDWEGGTIYIDSLFSNDKELVYAPLIDTSNVTNMSNMFNGCINLQTVPQFNTSNVTKMTQMFVNCSSLETIPLLDTSNVTAMDYMFSSCSSLKTIPQLNTTNVTKMNNMFSYCYSLKSIPLLDTSNVTAMERMFMNCESLNEIPLLDTSNVTNMTFMFNYCRSLNEIPLLNTSNVTNMSNMFANCQILKTIPQLNTSKVTNMNNMFSYSTALTSIPLLECGNVTNMKDIFGGFYTYSNLTDLGGFKDLKVSVTSDFLDKCPNLTVDSLMNVINNLYDLTANGLSGQSLKFSQTNLVKLSEEQIAVATAKGWTLIA